MTDKIPDRFPTVQIDDTLSCGCGFCDMQIHLVIGFSGRIDEQRLARAVRLSMDAEPVLGCRLHENFWRQSWLRRDDLDTLPLVTLAEAPAPETAISDYLVESLDPTQDPLVQARIFRAESDHLVIKMSHLASDAAGVLEYAEKLAAIYTALAADPGWRLGINLRGSRSIHQITSRLSWGDKVRLIAPIIRDYLGELFPGQNWAMAVRPGPPEQRKFIIRQYAGPGFRRVKEYARQSGCSLNDMLVAAFYRAFHSIIQPGRDVPLRLGTTVNLRRYLPGGRGEAICNLAAMFLLRLEADLGPDMAHTAAKVHAAMARYKRGLLGLEDKRYFLFDRRFIPFGVARGLNTLHQIAKMLIGPKSVCPWLTNMGAIEPGRLAFDKLAVSQAYLTAPVAYFPLFIAGLSGAADSITMSCGFCQTVMDGAVVERLFQLVEQELDSLAFTPQPPSSN